MTNCEGKAFHCLKLILLQPYSVKGKSTINILLFIRAILIDAILTLCSSALKFQLCMQQTLRSSIPKPQPQLSTSRPSSSHLPDKHSPPQSSSRPDPNQILTTSTLALSNTLCATLFPPPPSAATAFSSSVSVRGCSAICAYVPAARRFDSWPGFIVRTDSTTWRDKVGS